MLEGSREVETACLPARNADADMLTNTLNKKATNTVTTPILGAAYHTAVYGARFIDIAKGSIHLQIW